MFNLTKHLSRWQPGIIGRRHLKPRRRRGHFDLAIEWLEDRSLLAYSDLLYHSAFHLGSTGFDVGKAMATDVAGNYYVAGGMEGTVNFNPGGTAANRSGDVFAAKYWPDGSLEWARTVGGASHDFGYVGGDIFVDASSNVYLTGSFRGTVDFDPGVGTLNLSSPYNRSVFVLKLNSMGNLEWAKQYSATKDADATGIAVDSAGNVYTVGIFGDMNTGGTIDFDPGTGSGQVVTRTSLGKRDAFVASLNRDGNFRWAATVGGVDDDKAFDVGLDSLGNVYVAGEFMQTADFDPIGTSNLTSVGGQDVFIWKLNPSGTFLGAKAYGNTPTESVQGISVDDAGHVYMVGYFYGDTVFPQDFDPSPGDLRLINHGNRDVFIVKLNTDLSIAWGKSAGSKSEDGATWGSGGPEARLTIASDLGNNVFVVGTFDFDAGTLVNEFHPGIGAPILASAGGYDVFVLRLDNRTGDYVWAGRLGGTSDDYGSGLAVDNLGNVYTTGWFTGTADFDPSSSQAHNLTSTGQYDAFVTRLTYDLGLPRVTIEQHAAQQDPTNGTTIKFTAVFTEPVTDFTAGDVTISGTAPGNLIGTVVPVDGDGTTYNIEVTGMTGSGTVIASLAAGVAVDVDGNGNYASTSTDNVVHYDSTPPTAVLANPASSGSIGYLQLNNRGYIDVTFADAGGSGLNASSITDLSHEFSLSGAGSGVSLTAVAPTLVSGTTYRYPFTGNFSVGLVGVDFVADSFFDLSGNANVATANEFTAADLPTLSVGNVTVTEGNTTTNLVFTVSLSYPTDQQVTVQYATDDGTAKQAADYTSTRGSLTFAPFTTSKTVSVPILGDLLSEADESLFLNLNSPVNAKVPNPVHTGVGWIHDNDPVPTLSINDVTVTEGPIGATFTVTLSAISGQNVTFTYATVDHPANTATPRGTTAHPDYDIVPPTQVTLGPGTKTYTFPVVIWDDAIQEDNETFRVKLSDVMSATVVKDIGIGTITNNDPVPTVSISGTALPEGAANTSTNATFTAQLSMPSGKPVSVKYATANSTATAGKDYALSSGTFTFAPYEMTQTINIPVVGDDIDESDETFLVNLSSPVNATILSGSASGIILDDDPEPSITIGRITVVEGNSGTLNAVFPVTLSAASARSVTVQYATADVTALAGKDYTTKTGTLTFAPGTVSQSIAVSVTGDVLIEGDESFKVNLSAPTAATIAVPTGTATIIDNDPSITISDVTVTEGGVANFVVSLSMPRVASAGSPSPDLLVDFSTDDLASPDYVGIRGTLSFGEGVTKQTISVQTLDDTLDEATETFFVNLTNVRGANGYLADGQGKCMITDNDPPPALSISGGDVDEALGLATFTVSLSTESGQTVSVKYVTANGTAVASTATKLGDYTATTGTLTIPAGNRTGMITVPVVDDPTDENNETFKVTLNTPINVTLTTTTATQNVAIKNDDPPPVMSINDTRVTEGDLGTTNAIFTVSLSVASGKAVTVAYATVGDRATSGKDFTAKTGTLTFAPGIKSQTIIVPVVGEKIDEVDEETFRVLLSNIQNALLPVAFGTGTIVDNDNPPTISINDASATEDDINGANGFTAQFQVSLSVPSEREVQVHYNTQEIGSATSDVDYVRKADTLVFAPGVTVQPITIKNIGDRIDELNETYFVNLSTPTNASILRGTGKGTITDNDPAPLVWIDDITVGEGGEATFTVTLRDASGLEIASGQDVIVNYTLAAGATNPAQPGVDFISTVTPIIVFAGQTSQELKVLTRNDSIYEGNETFQVKVTTTNATVKKGTGIGTITDDDPLPVIEISSAGMPEGSSGTKNLEFSITRTGASAVTSSVTYTTGAFPPNSGIDSATADIDYLTQAGKITFGPSTADTITLPISIAVKGDLEVEKNEWFKVTLATPVNANVVNDTGIGLILNDDPTIAIKDVVVTEGNDPRAEVMANFDVVVMPNMFGSVSFDFATRDGTATSGEDYAHISSSVSLPPSSTLTIVTIPVPVYGDLMKEPSRYFYLDLTNVVGGFFSNGVDTLTAKGTINDNDPTPSVFINGPFSILEGDTGENPQVTFTLTLSAESVVPVSVNVATGNGTATTADNDYVQIPTPSTPPATYTFAPHVPGVRNSGERSIDVTVTINGDTKPESSEIFYVKLSAPVNATLANTQGQVTILDDDNRTLTINDVSVVEGNSGETEAEFTVRLSRASAQPVTVKYATGITGTATSNTDYIAVPLTTLTFEPNEIEKRIVVKVKGDLTKEPDETFFVNLSTPTNAVIGDAQGKGTIVNDDLGAWQVSVTVIDPERGYVVDTSGRIDTRVAGKSVATYPAYSFPSFNAYEYADPEDNLAWLAEWVRSSNGAWLGSGGACFLTSNEIEGGLAMTVYIGGTLMADPAASPPVGLPVANLSDNDLAVTTQAVMNAWAAAGLGGPQLAQLQSVAVRVADLPGQMLGAFSGNTVLLDRNAAGFGWFIDSTPATSEEFIATSATSLAALENSPAADRMDLFTVLAHEMGHALGLPDLRPSLALDELMASTLLPGVRRTDWTAEVDAVFAHGQWQ